MKQHSWIWQTTNYGYLQNMSSTVLTSLTQNIFKELRIFTSFASNRGLFSCASYNSFQSCSLFAAIVTYPLCLIIPHPGLYLTSATHFRDAIALEDPTKRKEKSNKFLTQALIPTEETVSLASDGSTWMRLISSFLLLTPLELHLLITSWTFQVSLVTSRFQTK